MRGNTKIDEKEPKQQRRRREKEDFWEGMWDLPRLGVKPGCPALAGGFFTREPPGKPRPAHSNLPLLTISWKVG